MTRSTKTPDFSLIARLMLLATLAGGCLLVAPQLVRAGDQEGIAGYKFKIYDADGDGIDGNEGSTAYGGGGSLSNSGGSIDRNDVARESIAVRFAIEELRWLLVWWR